VTAKDTLFLHVLWARGLVEERLIEEAIRLQREKAPDKPLSDLLVELGWLSAADRDALATEAQSGNPTVADPPTIMESPERATPLTMSGSTPPSRQGATVRNVRASMPGAIEGYEVLEEIAHGGMGIVYKARQVGLDRVVALKVMIAGEHATAEALERFHREAKSAAKLQHPNIVQIYDVGRDGSKHFFTMRYVGGLPVSKLVEKKEITPRRALEITRKIALALDYAHSQGVIHRDVKPSNIIVDAAGEPHLADFGLAKDSASGDLTAPGSRLGTPNYAPPEQVEGQVDKVDARSDVYSLGATLYEMLTGRPPFSGESMVNVLVQVLLHDPETPRKINPNVHRDIETICLKAMHKEPAKRYESAGAMARDVEHFLNGEPIQARPATKWDRVKSWVRKHRIAAACLTGLLIASVPGVWMVRDLLVERNRDREQFERERKEREREQEVTRLVQEELARRDAAERKRNEARELVDKGRSKTGANQEETFGEAILADPDWSEPYLERGKVRINMGKNEEAVEDLTLAIEKARAAGEKPVLAYYLRGRVLDARLHRGKQAAADYHAAVELDPESDLAHLALGAAHLRNLDFARGLRSFRDAIEANPKNPDAYYWRARMAFLGEAWGRVLDDTQAALKIQGNHLGAYTLNLAAQYAQANPPSPQMADQIAALPINDPELLLLLARGFAAKKDAQRAKALVDKAIQLDPKNPYCHQQKGYVLIALDAPKEEILAAFGDAVTNGPDDPIQPMLRGLLYMERFADREKAAADFEQAAKIDPDFPTVWLVRALFADRERRTGEALSHAGRALELGLDPGFAVLAGRTKGWCHVHLVELDAALATFEEAIRIKEGLEPWLLKVYSSLDVIPRDAKLYLDLAQIYVARGEYDKALAALDKSLADDSREFETPWLIGLIHTIRGENEEALERFSTALAITPMDETQKKQAKALEPQLRLVLRSAKSLAQIAPVFENLANMFFMFKLNEERQGRKSEDLDVLLRAMRDFQWLLWKEVGNAEKLVSAGEKVVKISPWDASAHVRLAVSYAIAGDAAKSAAALAEAEKRDFRNWAYMWSSPDFAKVRDDPAFRRR